jgi:hypothetical protein
MVNLIKVNDNPMSAGKIKLIMRIKSLIIEKATTWRLSLAPGIAWGKLQMVMNALNGQLIGFVFIKLPFQGAIFK